MAQWQIFSQEFLRPVHPPEASDQLYHCGGGVDSFAIDPYGKMSICVLSQQDQYDLRTGTVQRGWDGFLRQIRETKKITRLTKCISCELKAMCGMCPANGELENGDPEAPVDFLCRVAHLRAYAMDLPVRPHGACEYCEGGSGHDELMRSVPALRAIAPGGPSGLTSSVFLPMAAQSAASDGACGSGGCSSCGH